MSLTTINLSDSLPKKSLKITFIFPNNAQMPITIEGLRTEIFIQQTGQESGGSAKIKLHAPDFEIMLQMLQGNGCPLQEMPLMLALSGAEVKIEAGDHESSFSLIFHGKITHCHANFCPPHRLLRIRANATLLYNTQKLKSLSYETPVWASQILKDLCAGQEINLENNGFDYLLVPPVSFHGTFLSQIKQIVKPQNGFFHFDPLQNRLSVSKKKFSNIDEPLVLENADLIGLTACSQQLISLRCLFQPSVKLGQKFFLNIPEIEIENINFNHKKNVSAPWNGLWIIHSFSHLLSSEKTAIHWETHLHAFRLS